MKRSRGSSLDFSKPWHRDAHLPKLDARLLPVLKLRWWTPAELAEYHAEKHRGCRLTPDLIERWLASARERGLAQPCARAEDEAAGRWEVTEAGRSRSSFATALFQGLGGLPGAAGLASFAIALCADRVSSSLRPLVIASLFYLVGLAAAVVIGRIAAERSQTLLRRVIEREAVVQEEMGPSLDCRRVVARAPGL